LSNTLDPQAVLAWYYQHGRHDLPWQQDIHPYRVWISEIMLQQTQVATVIPYYQRFIQRFPDVEALADANLDEVLHLWTGLGYYARARNLHKAANIISHENSGQFPADLEGLTALPGIGRSTAGAILAIGHGKRGVILDGNVKRVLCRFYAITEWSGSAAAQRQLWALADAATPQHDVAAYTQAVMDIGATVCTRSKPTCPTCPLKDGCRALATGQVATLPASKPRKALPEKQLIMVMYLHNNAVLLQQRASIGLWGGLWSLPELADESALEDWLHMQQAQLSERWPVLRHTFSHFHMDIQPVVVQRHVDATAPGPLIAEPGPAVLWHPLTALRARRTTARTASPQGELDIGAATNDVANDEAPSAAAPQVGMAAPVKKLLQQLAARIPKEGAPAR